MFSQAGGGKSARGGAELEVDDAVGREVVKYGLGGENDGRDVVDEEVGVFCE